MKQPGLKVVEYAMKSGSVAVLAWFPSGKSQAEMDTKRAAQDEELMQRLEKFQSWTQGRDGRMPPECVARSLDVP